MTLDNLITLITAGFTKEEILTMSGTATQRAPQGQHPAHSPQRPPGAPFAGHGQLWGRQRKSSRKSRARPRPVASREASTPSKSTSRV